MAATFDYIRSQADADQLLAFFGQAVNLRRTASTGAAFAPTQITTDFPTLAAITNLTRWYPPIVEGTDILRTDRRGLISAKVPVQKFDQLVLADGSIFKILDVKPVAPGGIVVLYDAWLRV